MASHNPQNPTHDMTKFGREVERLENVIDRTVITCREHYAGCFETVMELRKEFQRFCLSDRTWETQESLKCPLDVLTKTQRLGLIFDRIEKLDMGGQHDLRGTLNPAYWSLVMSHDVLWNMLAFHARSDGEIVSEIKQQRSRLPEKARFTLDETIQDAERKYGRVVNEPSVVPSAADVKIPESVWGHDKMELQVAGKARLACVEAKSLERYFDCFAQQVSRQEGSLTSEFAEENTPRPEAYIATDVQTPKGFHDSFLLALVIGIFVWGLSVSGRQVHDAPSRRKLATKEE